MLQSTVKVSSSGLPASDESRVIGKQDSLCIGVFARCTAIYPQIQANCRTGTAPTLRFKAYLRAQNIKNIRNGFSRELPKWISKLPRQMNSGVPTYKLSRIIQSLLPLLSFPPDGRLLASCSADETIKLWDPITGERLQTLRGHTGWGRLCCLLT